MNDNIIIIIDDYYFDLTEYANIHPGGKRILQKYKMKDATDEFNSIKGHGDAFAIDELNKYCIGKVNEINIHKYLTKKNFNP
jgi:cytochrome b involved in lipid metabolism